MEEKNNSVYCVRAFERALELLDLTLDCPKNHFRLKEIARTREVLVDFFYGENHFSSSEKSLSAYFFSFCLCSEKASLRCFSSAWLKPRSGGSFPKEKCENSA